MTDQEIFLQLFSSVCQQAFGTALARPLTEAESKLLSIRIHEKTGLMIGAKSLRNYSLYVFNPKERQENPSVATLDTLARYFLNAPYTDEVKRKTDEGHHPYWYTFRKDFATSSTTPKKGIMRKLRIYVIVIVGFLAAGLVISRIGLNPIGSSVSDDFSQVKLAPGDMKGWRLKNPDASWWGKRNDHAGHLSLFTLKGDNWNNGDEKMAIRNLLYRPLPYDCFTTEIRIADFFPEHSWQQAGIIISEDSTFDHQMIRLSVSYNDFFGGYEQPAEIVIQGVSSVYSGDRSKPEEFAHVTAFRLKQGEKDIVRKNLSKVALRIDRNGDHFRLLYASGSMERFAFSQAAERNFRFTPRYIGVFAMQGMAEKEQPMPVLFDSFRMSERDCE